MKPGAAGSPSVILTSTGNGKRGRTGASDSEKELLRLWDGQWEPGQTDQSVRQIGLIRGAVDLEHHVSGQDEPRHLGRLAFCSGPNSGRDLSDQLTFSARTHRDVCPDFRQLGLRQPDQQLPQGILSVPDRRRSACQPTHRQMHVEQDGCFGVGKADLADLVGGNHRNRQDGDQSLPDPPIAVLGVDEPVDASGEEAYSLAILLAEILGPDQLRLRAKVYATDVDEEAFAIARQAAYTERDLAGVPEPRVDKYFEQHGSRFVFRKEIRRTVIFGRNDLVQDAPISHVDVLACRNTLMYFNAEAQARILQRMHFALRPDGVLFLKAEMLLGHTHLFRPLEDKRRFFTKVATHPRDRSVIGRPGDTDAPTDSDRFARLRQAAMMSSPFAQIVLDQESRVALTTSCTTPRARSWARRSSSTT